MSEPGITVPIADRLVLEPKEVAALIGCHANTVYRFIKHEGLPTFTIYKGGNYLIHREALDRWLAERAGIDAA